MLLETPGGGVSLNGEAKGRAAAKQARARRSPARADQGLEIAEADVRVAIDQAPGGRRRAAARCRSAGAARSRAKTAAQARYLEALASTTGVRPGPGRHRQDLPGRGPRRGPAAARRGRPAGRHPPGGGGGRAAGLPARRPDREGRSLHGAGLGGADRHPGRRAAAPAPRPRRDRGGADRLHARPHPRPRLRHRRRGAERLAPADEDGADPPGRRRAHGGHRRSQPGRPGQPRRLRPGPRGRLLEGVEGRRRHPLRRRGRGAPSAGRADRRAPTTPTPPSAVGRADDRGRDRGSRPGARPLPRRRGAAPAAAAATLALERAGGRRRDAILLTDDARLRRSTRRFRGKDAPTNVLVLPGAARTASGTWATSPWPSASARAKRRAGQAAGASPAAPDHPWRAAPSRLRSRDRRRGRGDGGLERAVLAGLGVADPYAPRRADARPWPTPTDARARRRRRAAEPRAVLRAARAGAAAPSRPTTPTPEPPTAAPATWSTRPRPSRPAASPT